MLRDALHFTTSMATYQDPMQAWLGNQEPEFAHQLFVVVGDNDKMRGRVILSSFDRRAISTDVWSKFDPPNFASSSSSFLLLSSLELSDTQVYEPEIRARPSEASSTNTRRRGGTWIVDSRIFPGVPPLKLPRSSTVTCHLFKVCKRRQHTRYRLRHTW